MDRTTDMLASYTLAIDYAALSSETVHEAKRRILDSLACGLAAFHSDPARIACKAASTVESAAPARVLGADLETAADLAAFANTVMIRYLDCNDSFVSVGGGHPSDMLPAVLAGAEVAGRSGRDVLPALVAAYEIYGRFAEACAIRDRGWDQGIFISLGSACAAGKLLGLSEQQLGHAISLAAVASVPLGQTRSGELSMWKGCATAAAVRHGVFSAMLAAQGMEGPPLPFEGRFGLFEQVTGTLDLAFPASGNGLPCKIAETSIKYFPAQIHTQSGAAMALDLRAGFDLDDVDAIRIDTYGVAVRNAAGGPEKWDPRTRETADHSLPYVVAVALADGSVTPESFSEGRRCDARLRSLMRCIEVHEDPDLTRGYPARQGARMEIRLKSGRRLYAETAHPKGHFRNPLNDAELVAKFGSLTAHVLALSQQEELVNRIWHLEDLERLEPLFAAAQVGRSAVP